VNLTGDNGGLGHPDRRLSEDKCERYRNALKTGDFVEQRGLVSGRMGRPVVIIAEDVEGEALAIPELRDDGWLPDGHWAATWGAQ
jgi:hypothetical protein